MAGEETVVIEHLPSLPRWLIVSIALALLGVTDQLDCSAGRARRDRGRDHWGRALGCGPNHPADVHREGRFAARRGEHARGRTRTVLVLRTEEALTEDSIDGFDVVLGSATAEF
ncbi:MAG: hypothetical protein H7269_02115 [Cellulomonas sp.]|nr:hypothetical protein [Cellulomonas sp.]